MTAKNADPGVAMWHSASLKVSVGATDMTANCIWNCSSRHLQQMEDQTRNKATNVLKKNVRNEQVTMAKSPQDITGKWWWGVWSSVWLHMKGLNMLYSAVGSHVMMKWHAAAALHLNWLSLFVVVVTACLSSLMLKIFIPQFVYCMSKHLPHSDVPLVEGWKRKWWMNLSFFSLTLKNCSTFDGSTAVLWPSVY